MDYHKHSNQILQKKKVKNIAGQYIADTLDTLSKKIKDDRIDVHRLIGKLPPPKAGYTPSKYKYMGK